MTAPPAPSAPSISLPQMQVLVARAGLVLNPGQMADLVLVWRQLAGLIASIPRDRPLLDDQAFVFRLPPPEAAARPVRAKPSPARRVGATRGQAMPAPAPKSAALKPAGKLAGKPAPKPAPKPAGKPAPKPRGKSAAKPAAKRKAPAPPKPARRGTAGGAPGRKAPRSRR